MYYRTDFGLEIKRIRKKERGFSQRRLAKLVGTDIETIRMIEDGSLPNPEPQLILRIATELDSFYLEFVRKERELQFLKALNWGEYADEEDIDFLIDVLMSICTLTKEDN